MTLQRWIRRWWQGDAGIVGAVFSLLTFPLELVFRGLVWLREGLYRRGWRRVHRAPLPVISVGNLTVGGTGKTPFSAWIAAELLRRGERPAILARGYGRDELLLHERWNPDIPVYTGADRLRSAREAARGGATVAVLDDGFQHRRIHRELDIVLLSVDRQAGVSRLLPRGPFREPRSALGRADLVIVSEKGLGARSEPQGDAAGDVEAETHRCFPSLPMARIRLQAGEWRNLSGEKAPPPHHPTVALASIAKPDAFGALVTEAVGQEVELLEYPDHHEYTEADIARIAATARGGSVVTTEKDAVKLAAYSSALPPVTVIPLALTFVSGRENLDTALAAVLSGQKPGTGAGEGATTGGGGSVPGAEEE